MSHVRPRVVVLHGLPGVGKLTVGRELARNTGWRLFHNHLTVDLLTAVFEFGSPAFVEWRERIWLEVLGRAVRDGIEGVIFTFAAEATVSPAFLETLAGRIDSEGGETFFVELRCEPDELLRRVETDDRTVWGKLASADSMVRLLAEGTLFDARVPVGARACTVDTTTLPPGDAAKAIERLVSGAADGS